MQHMNRGTRNASCPEGGGSLERERIGNEVADRILVIFVRSCPSMKIFSPLRIHKTSWAWHLKAMRDAFKLPGVTEVIFDQCGYGLTIPDASGSLGLAQEPTKFGGNLPFMSHLHRQCKCSRTHVQVIGGVKTGKDCFRRSQLAGAYPRGLCSEYHRCCQKMFALTFLIS